MEENIVYQYNVNKILSIKKNPNKVNAVLINDKYFFQIKNDLEEGMVIEEKPVPYEQLDQLESLTEDGEFAQLTKLEDLFKLCSVFQLKDEITYPLIFQFLKFQKVNNQLMGCYFRSDITSFELKERKENMQNFIINHGKNIICNSLNFPRSNQIKDNYESFFRKQLLLHPSILTAQFQPVNILEFEKLILSKQIEKISKEDQERFSQWMKLIDNQAISVNTIFNDSFDLKPDDVWDSSRVQQDINTKTNSLPIQETFIDVLKKKKKIQYSVLKQILVGLEKNQSNNSGFDINILQEFEEETDIWNKYLSQSLDSNRSTIADESVEGVLIKKAYLEVRLKNNKYRFATRNQSLDEASYMFDKIPNTMRLTSFLLPKIRDMLSEKGQNITLVSLDIQNFSLNIDYEIVDKLLKLPTVADYVRNRKVIYFDPVIKKEEEISMKKGILIGDPFHDFILYELSTFIMSMLSSIMKIYFKGSRYYNYNDDFLFAITHTLDDGQAVLLEVKKFLKFAEVFLMNLGFRLNVEKIKILNKIQEKQVAWKVNQQFQFVETPDFEIQGEQLIKQPSKKENLKLEDERQDLRDHVNAIVEDIHEKKENLQHVFGSYSDFQKIFTIKFLDDYKEMFCPNQKLEHTENSIDYLKSDLFGSFHDFLKIFQNKFLDDNKEMLCPNQKLVHIENSIEYLKSDLKLENPFYFLKRRKEY